MSGLKIALIITGTAAAAAIGTAAYLHFKQKKAPFDARQWLVDKAANLNVQQAPDVITNTDAIAFGNVSHYSKKSLSNFCCI
jgi:hypothetical protein